MHGLATGTESRQQLYTMLTRGRHANHLYLQVVGDGDPHTVIRPENLHPQTATDLLQESSPATTPPSPHPRCWLSRPPRHPPADAATARYLDASTSPPNTTSDSPRRPPRRRRRPGRRRPHRRPGVAHPARPPHPARRERRRPPHPPPDRRGARELDTAGDRAAVLDWRLPDPNTAGTAPLPWLPSIPQTIANDPHWGSYLTARSDLVTTLADEVRQQAMWAAP
jgi:hypothetical protein